MSKRLHITLFKNTLHFMDDVSKYGKLAEYIRKNFYSRISYKIDILHEKISAHKGIYTSKAFLEKWNLLHNPKPREKDVRTAYEIDNTLTEIIKVFEDSPGIVVAESYLNELNNKKDSLLDFKTNLTVDNIKKIMNHEEISESKNDNFKAPLPNIFIEYAMIPYFSENQNAAHLEHYLMWLRNPDNLLKVSDEKKAEPKYQVDEKDSIRIPVESYIDANGFSFNEEDFFSMMKIIFNHLSYFSEYHNSKSNEMDDKKILEDIKRKYLRLIFPNGGYFFETIGVSEEELNIILDCAAYDALTAYHAYCKRFKVNQRPSWNKCISYGGFYTEMLYFLYSRLWQHESFYLKKIALDIRDLAWKENKTFINEEAIISPTVFIKEECIIEKAEIKDNVYLSHCKIYDGVIIENDVIIDLKCIVIEQDMCVETGIVIDKLSYKQNIMENI